MPQEKKFETRAERQRAYRARQRFESSPEVVEVPDDEPEIVNPPSLAVPVRRLFPEVGYGWSKEREGAWVRFVASGKTDGARARFTRESFPHLVKK
mgnify:CR=1 FL=1|jgi:hypothetical protein